MLTDSTKRRNKIYMCKKQDCFCKECMKAMDEGFGNISATVQRFYDEEEEE